MGVEYAPLEEGQILKRRDLEKEEETPINPVQLSTSIHRPFETSLLRQMITTTYITYITYPPECMKLNRHGQNCWHKYAVVGTFVHCCDINFSITEEN